MANSDLFSEYCDVLAHAYETTATDAANTLNNVGITAENIDNYNIGELLQYSSYGLTKNPSNSKIWAYTTRAVENVQGTVNDQLAVIDSNIQGTNVNVDIPLNSSTSTGSSTDVVEFTAVSEGTGTGASYDGISFSGIAGTIGGLMSIVSAGWRLLDVVDPELKENIEDALPEWWDDVTYIDPMSKAYKEPGITLTKKATDSEPAESHLFMEEHAFAYNVKWINDNYAIFSESTSDTTYTDGGTVDGVNVAGGIPLATALKEPVLYDHTLVGTATGTRDLLYYYPIATYTGTTYENYKHPELNWGIEYSGSADNLPDNVLDYAHIKATCYKYVSGGNTHYFFIVASDIYDLSKVVSGTTDGSAAKFFRALTKTTNATATATTTNSKYTYEDKTVYYSVYAFSTDDTSSQNITSKIKFYDFGENIPPSHARIAWTMFYTVSETPSTVVDIPSGITKDDSAAQLNLDGVDTTDLDAIITALKTQLPSLWNNTVIQHVVQPDGTTNTYTYIEVPYITTSTGVGTQTKYNSGTQTQTNLGLKANTVTNAQTNTALETATEPATQTDTKTATPNPTRTGTGNAPTVVVPTGTASSLYAIYNPTHAQLDSFAGWLWSADFVDQLLKLFNDPMQAIIGLHKVYATPSRGATQNIKVGYLDSGVSSRTVSAQYTTIDCGSVSVNEVFGSVFDYEPYTRINLFLPFIGVVPLSTADVMRSTIKVKYTVDVLTGACLADVIVTRDGGGGSLYQYGGNASVTLPVSSGSYMGIVSSLASIAGGVAATVASGGAAAPMLLGSVGGIMNAHTTVEHSGGFGGNVGAMGGKKPYLIISRPQTALAGNYQDYEGVPANTTVTIGNCTGYTQFQQVHLEGIMATGGELQQIENLLKSGVLI